MCVCVHVYVHVYHKTDDILPDRPSYKAPSRAADGSWSILLYVAPKCTCCLPRIPSYTRLTFLDSAKTARNVTQPSFFCQPGRARRRRVEQLMGHGLYHDMLPRNARVVCQEFQVTLAYPCLTVRKRLVT